MPGPVDGSWNPTLYDREYSCISRFATDLVDLLSPRTGERILDLGCGTGHLTYQIAQEGAEVMGIDISPAMVEAARVNYPGLTFEVADGADFHFEQSFDAVFSNAAIHWIKEPVRAIACIWRALKPGGRLVAELGGKGNVEAVVSAMKHALGSAGFSVQAAADPWYFPSIGQFGTLVESQGFRLVYATLTARPTPLEGGEEGLSHWIEMFAGEFMAGLPEEDRMRVTSEVENRLRGALLKEGTWNLDYRRLRCVALKD